jgi:protease-4
MDEPGTGGKMKRGTYVLIIFLIFFFLIIISLASFFYLEFGRQPSVKAHSYLEIKLSGSLDEKSSPDFFTSLIGMSPPLSMHDIWFNFQKAKIDRRISAIVLRMGYLQCGWAKVNELRELVLDFRKSGKKAYAVFEESVDADKEYYLATACDRIIFHPSGMMFVNGIGGYLPFFKKGLDKLGVEYEVEHIEKYKTAMNEFTEEGFTPAHKEMMESLYEDIYSHYVKKIAEAREKSVEEIEALIDQGLFQGPSAVKAGLVDDLLYEDELQNFLQENGRRLTRISHQAYSKIKPSSLGLNKGRKIALIYGTGQIITGEGIYQMMGSSTAARWLRRARLDKSIEAVVFRVDSPGGSAVGSDVIWREVILTKKEKPIVVSMSDVAGSGGYWIAMSAHKIVAQPQTWTGSIGVVWGKPNFQRLYEKLGISGERLTFGKKADIFSTFRRWTDEERELIKNEMFWTYDQFLTKVAEGRNMSKEDVDNLGKGRVWTGAQAKELGLVDELGGLSEAIQLAKELAGIPAEERVRLDVQPKKVSFIDMFLGRQWIKSSLGIHPKIDEMLSALKGLEREQIWAIMPFWLSSLQ